MYTGIYEGQYESTLSDCVTARVQGIIDLKTYSACVATVAISVDQQEPEKTCAERNNHRLKQWKCQGFASGKILRFCMRKTTRAWMGVGKMPTKY